MVAEKASTGKQPASHVVTAVKDIDTVEDLVTQYPFLFARGGCRHFFKLIISSAELSDAVLGKMQDHNVSARTYDMLEEELVAESLISE